jgi:hypothetical protein
VPERSIGGEQAGGDELSDLNGGVWMEQGEVASERRVQGVMVRFGRDWGSRRRGDGYAG